MIIGNGVDIIDNKRIEKSLKIKGFKKRLFTLNEINQSKKYRNKTNYFAKRFAAKEAFFKAIGTNNRLQFNEIEVKNNSVGAPKIVLKGLSQKNLKKIFKNQKFKIHLSLSDDKPWAVASVIIFTYK